MDEQTTVAALRDMVRRFVDARQWHQFHSPKNLSMALAIEAAELMEHFQWITAQDARKLGQNRDKLKRVAEELADVMCYGCALANELEIDISSAMQDKMRKNEEKYPVDQYQGRYGPEDEGRPQSGGD